jgi:hypothetical protein
VFARALVGWQKAQTEVAAVLDDAIPVANRKLLHLTRAIWNG